MKKKLITAVLMTCIGWSLMAQQMPLYSQTYFMRMMYNPALTAYNGSTNVYAFDREQWVALPGHPETRGAMGEISLWKDQSGVGVHVYNDITDIISRINAQIYYAQKIRLAKNHTLSLGISAGIMQTRVDFNSVVANDLQDPNLLNQAKGGIAFDMGVGLAYQWKKLTIGVSVPHIANSDITLYSQLKNTQYNTLRQYTAHASYEISFQNEKWNLEPSVMVMEGYHNPVQASFGAVANYKRALFLGIGYRLDYGLTGMAAVRIAKTVTIGYSYDYSIISGVQSSALGGTHEVIVGVNFDRWLKNPESARQARKIDSMEREMGKLKRKNDEISQRVDTLEQKQKELANNVDDNKKAENSLEGRVDALDQQIKDYKNRVANSPVGSFSGNGNVNAGDIYKMDRVYFETNSSNLKEASYIQLDKLVKMLKENAGMQIRVLGHTDYIASDAYNMALSERRANAVSKYLISKGVDPSKVTAIGFGKRLPVADNTTVEGRALNRRVEIDIIKK